MSRSLWYTSLALGILAELFLAGVLRALPPAVAFAVGSLALLLFSGAAITQLFPAVSGRFLAAERVPLWSALGLSLVTILGTVALAARATINDLRVLVAAVCAVLFAAVATRGLARGRSLQPPTPPTPPTPTLTLIRPHAQARLILVAVAAVGLVLGLLTLVAPRDSDDWYYLAYIADFTTGNPLGSQEAVYNSGPPPARIMYAGWWAVEALLAKVSGADSVPTHQIYLPVLLAPFAILAAYALAREILQSERAALAGALLQAVFYVSSAFPNNNAGYMLLARTSQDKSVACFVIVPVAVALALRFARRAAGEPAWAGYFCYALALLGGALVHPMAVVWVFLGVVPFLVAEAWREKMRGVRTLALLLVPVVIAIVLLAPGVGDVSEELGSKTSQQLAAREGTSGRAQMGLVASYLPGRRIPWTSATVDYSALVVTGGKPRSVNPLYVTRFPLALAGLILTFALLARARRDSAARYLAITTLTALGLAFIPGVASLASRALSWKMLYRILWTLPWGYTIAFFLARIRWRWLPPWAAVVLIALGLARGNPVNYASSLMERRQMFRPDRDQVEALKALAREPRPQGVVLAPPPLNSMVAAFAPGASPAEWGATGPLTREEEKALLEARHLDGTQLQKLAEIRCKYLLVAAAGPFTAALVERPDEFRLAFENRRYQLWQFAAGVHPLD